MAECKKQNRNKNKPANKAYTAGCRWQVNKARRIIVELRQRDGRNRTGGTSFVGKTARQHLHELPVTAIRDACQRLGISAWERWAKGAA